MDNTRNPLSLLLLYLAPFSIAGDLPHEADPKMLSLNSGLVAFYIGLLPIVLVGLGLSKWSALERKLRIYFASLIVIAWVFFLAGMHWNSWSLQYVLNHIPVLNWFHFHTRFIFVASFASALLAGFGVDALLQNSKRIIKAKLLSRGSVLFLIWLMISCDLLLFGLPYKPTIS